MAPILINCFCVASGRRFVGLMRVCGYCGRSNEGTSWFCRECGCELSDPGASTPPRPSACLRRPQCDRIHRKVTAAILLVFGFMSACLSVLDAILALWAEGTVAGRSYVAGHRHLAHSLVAGIGANALIAFLCIASFQLTRRKTPRDWLAAACAITVVLFLTAIRWMISEIRTPDPLNWLEPLTVWPSLAYVAIYAYGRSKRGK